MKLLGLILTMPAFVMSNASSGQVVSAGSVLPGESLHFQLFGQVLPEQRTTVDQFDEIFDYVASRLGVSIADRIAVTFSPPEPGLCPSRARIFPITPLPPIFIYIDESTGSKQISGAFAHELGHVLHLVAIHNGRTLSSNFAEGFASWAAGRYWLDWMDETFFQSAVAKLVDTGAYLPLHENDGQTDTVGAQAANRYGEDCMKRRDILYTEWAAFIDYLVDKYGRDKLYELIRTGAPLSDPTSGAPDFASIYGSTLPQLEAEWLRTLVIPNGNVRTDSASKR